MLIKGNKLVFIFEFYFAANRKIYTPKRNQSKTYGAKGNATTLLIGAIIPSRYMPNSTFHSEDS